MNEREQLEQAIATLEAQRAILGDAVVDAALGPMREKLSTLLPTTPLEQRKQATILFADLEGFTAMSATMDPEEVRAITGRYFHTMTPIIRRYGGQIEKYIGDAIMAVFGIPIAHEYDPEHAIRAALDMQQAVKELNKELGLTWGVQLAVRIGINTGLLLVGYLGEDFTVIGDTVNLASRLEHAAPPGGVLISHDTYRHVRGLFGVQLLEPVLVKGKAEPVQVYLVRDVKPRSFHLGTRGIEGVETRMIGRDDELSQLQQALRSVIEAQELRAITIIGEAGVGKSRLLYEYRSWVNLLPEKIWLFQGRATQEMEHLPYSLLRDIFAFRFDIRESDPPLLAREKLEQGIVGFMEDDPDAQMKAHFIGHLVGLDFSASSHLHGILEDAQQIRDRALRYLTHFFTAVMQKGPVQLLLEDIHWADDGSLDALYHLMEDGRTLSLLLLYLARPTLLERRPTWGEGEQYRGHQRILLAPLSNHDIRRLVTEVLQKMPEIPEPLLELVMAGSEGNPYYVEELIKMLIEERVILVGPEFWQVELMRLTMVHIPPTLTGVLQARLDSLPVAERDILQKASIIGRVFWGDAVISLQNTTSPSAVDAQRILEALHGRELVFRRDISAFAMTEEYTFKHALLQEVTYETILKWQRAHYHAQAARWLIEKSGARAEEYAALIAGHYERAGLSKPTAEWYERAATQAHTTYAPKAAITYYKKALAFIPQSVEVTDSEMQRRRMRLLEGFGEVLLLQTHYAEAVETYLAMRDMADALDDRLTSARSWNHLSQVYEIVGPLGRFLECTEQAERLLLGEGKEISEMPPPYQLELASALYRKGWALYRLGQPEMALEMAQQVMRLSDRLGGLALREMAQGKRLMGVVHMMVGQYDQAEGYMKQSLAAFQELGDRRWIARLWNALGENARLRGDYKAAISAYQAALTIALETGNRDSEIMYRSNLGGAYVGMGRYREAEQELEYVTRLAALVAWGGLSETECFLAEAYFEQGKLEQARDMAQQALQRGIQAEQKEFIANGWRVLGKIAMQLDCGKEPAECFAESLHIFTEIRMSGERARTLWAWATYELAAGDFSRGKAMWQEARSLFEHLKMSQMVQRMDDLFLIREEGAREP